MVVANSDSYIGAIIGLNDDLVIEDALYVEEYDSSDSDHNVQINGSLSLDGGLYFNKNSNVNSNELYFNYDDSDRTIIGYGSSVMDRELHVNSVEYFNLSPEAGVNGLYIDKFGKIGLAHNTPSQLFHIKKANIEMRLESKGSGDGDVQVQFDSAKSGILGYSSNVPGQMVISDGENMEFAGADLSIDSSGNLDIGYNVTDAQNSPQPSHNVRVDVLEKFNVKGTIRENGAVLTHMPEGSIVMFWTTDLPDGWYLCTGVPSTTSTSCNFVDYFIVGKIIQL